jgi:transposase
MPKQSRRELIKRVIRRRIAQSEPITIREIHQESGGSFSTIQDELERFLEDSPDIITGNRALSAPERMRDMQKQILILAEKNTALAAESEAHKHSLELFRNELYALIGQLVFTNKEMVKGLDELRQTVAKVRPATAPTSEDNKREAVLAEARLAQTRDELIKAHHKIDEMRKAIFELGGDFD